MNILFVTMSVPFPVRQGVELPLQNLIERFAEKHVVDLLILTGSEQQRKEYADRKNNVPSSVNDINSVQFYNNKKRLGTALRELSGIAPAFLLDSYNPDDIKNTLYGKAYDAVWISPICGLGIIIAARNLGYLIDTKVAIGHNDTKWSLYWDGFKQILHGRDLFDSNRVLQGLRVPWIWFYERRYLSMTDLVHVQTPLEKQRLEKVLGHNHCVGIIDAPNGKKAELEAVSNHESESRKVLFMTHLKGGRKKESSWFLRKIWPKVLASVPDAHLLLVGTPPYNDKLVRDLPPNVEICGYVDDLAELFASVSLSVVPTRHGTGRINRISDSLTAGLPIIACSEPLKTIPGLIIGKHALKGDTADEFAKNVIDVLSDNQLNKSLSENAKELGGRLPTWDATAARIDKALSKLVGY